MKAIEMDYSQSENIEIDDKVQETETKRKFEESIDQQRTINDFIKWISEEELISLKKEFLVSIESNPFFKKLYNENWFDDKIIQYVRYKFLISKDIENPEVN